MPFRYRLPRLTAALLVATSIIAAPALAQDAPRLIPGHADLDASRIGARADTFAVYIEQDGQTFTTGFVALSTEFDEAGRLTRTETVLDPWSEPLWEERFALDAASLRPLWQRTEAGDDFREVTFEQTSARLRQLEDGVETTRDAALDAPAFYTNSIDLVLVALPLRGGYHATLGALDVPALAPETITVEVVGEGQTPDHGGTYHETWVVEVTTRRGTDLYFVEQATGALVRYESPEQGVVFVRW
jgi:hypothetical protein